MSDAIQPVRYNPPTERVNPKKESSDKKGDKKEEKDFLDYIKDKKRDENQDKENLDQESTEGYTDKDEDSTQIKRDNDPDGSCGTMIDTEV